MREPLLVMDRSISRTPQRASLAASWRVFFALLGCYLAGHFILRLNGSVSLEFDEAEQFLLVQALASGYNTQPPLPTWCFWGLSQLAGESLATLTALRLGILGLSYFFLYATARLLLSDRRRALLVAASLLLIPAIGWESVVDRVHTTLLCALCLATLYVTLQVLHDGRQRWFLLLGLCLGLGMLCKYNYALFALALLLATLTMPGYRSRLMKWPLLATLIIALLVVLPHLHWLTGHWQQLLALIRAKGLVGESGPVIARLRGLGMIASNTGQVLGAMLAILMVCFPQVCRPSVWTGGEPRRWLDRFLLASLLILTGVVLVEGMAHIRLYWMLPMLTVVPLAFFLRIENATFRPAQWAGFAAVVLASAAGVMLGRMIQAEHHQPRDTLYETLAAQLRADGFRGGVVWSEGHQHGGNLRRHLPAAQVLCVTYPLFTPPAVAGPPRLLLWDASFRDGVSPFLRIWGRERGMRVTRDSGSIRYVESPLTTAGQRERVGYLLLTE